MTFAKTLFALDLTPASLLWTRKVMMRTPPALLQNTVSYSLTSRNIEHEASDQNGINWHRFIEVTYFRDHRFQDHQLYLRACVVLVPCSSDWVEKPVTSNVIWRKERANFGRQAKGAAKRLTEILIGLDYQSLTNYTVKPKRIDKIVSCVLTSSPELGGAQSGTYT